MEAHDFVEMGESAVVVFTREGAFEMNDAGSGLIPNLPINIHQEIDRVILFVAGAQAAAEHEEEAEERGDAEENRIFVADYAGIDESEDVGFTLLFEEADFVGATDSEWSAFAGTGSSPVRYIQPSPRTSYGP